jgi:hypothetical protein
MRGDHSSRGRAESSGNHDPSADPGTERRLDDSPPHDHGLARAATADQALRACDLAAVPRTNCIIS